MPALPVVYFELHAFGDYLVRNKAWDQNVFRRVYAPRVPRKLPRYLSIEDMNLLLQVCDKTTPAGLRNQAILEVLYASGVRVSEIAGLNLDMVDLTSGELRVVGKGNKERIALLGRPAVAVLRQYIDTGRSQYDRETHHKCGFSQSLWWAFIFTVG